MKIKLYVQKTRALGVTVNMVRLSTAKLIKEVEIDIKLPDNECATKQITFAHAQVVKECERIKQELQHERN